MKINKKKIGLVMIFLLVAAVVIFCIIFFAANRREIGLNDAQSKNSSAVVSSENNNEKIIIEKSETIRMLYFGDMMLDRHVGEKIEEKGVDYIFEKIASATSTGLNKFEHYDIVGCNLEGAVTDNGAHYAPVNLYDFAFAPDTVLGLKKYGFNFFNLANNHFADQGENGIIETRKNLKNKGFFYTGCRDRKVGECSSTIITAGNKKIGMAGFSMVYGLFDKDDSEIVVGDLASSTDLVVVNIHWGVEYEHSFNKTQKQVARNLIDAGADIIIGHHPHVVQGMEIYNNVPIFYSLGNFVFDQYFSPDTQEGLAVAIQVEEDEILFKLLPFKTRISQIEPMNRKEEEVFLNKFLVWSLLEEKQKEEVKNGKIKIKRND